MLNECKNISGVYQNFSSLHQKFKDDQ